MFLLRKTGSETTSVLQFIRIILRFLIITNEAVNLKLNDFYFVKKVSVTFLLIHVVVKNEKYNSLNTSRRVSMWF